jgi:type II secretory pathway component PulK
VLAESIVRFRGELQEQQETDSGVSGTAPIAVEPTSGEAEDEATSQLVQGPIRSLSELLEIEGFTEALLYEKREEEAPLETLLTTVSSGKVNVNSASEAVLTAVGFNEGQVNSILAQREESPFTSLESLEQAISDDPERWQRLSRFFDVRSTTFRLLAQASLPGQTRIYHVSATLSTGSSALTFIRWSEY